MLCASLMMAVAASMAGAAGDQPAGLERLAQQHRETVIYSTLMFSEVVNEQLGTEDGIEEAIQWCKKHGISKVYLETYRNKIWAKRNLIERARDRFASAGFIVAGCITPEGPGRPSYTLMDGKLTPDPYSSCYTHPETQAVMEEIFEYTASLFDEIIIDDFFCTICECNDCSEAKGDASWGKYRTDLLVKVSQERLLGPARKVNPNVRITIKYPNYYDHLYARGYDIDRQTVLFEEIFTGTETREPKGLDSNPQYGAYFMMQWLNAVGGAKNGGGWFDYIDTNEATYVEQARQTVLGQAREVMLFHYRELKNDEAPQELLKRLVAEMPELFELAELVKGKKAHGASAPRPINASDLGTPGEKIHSDRYVYSFLGVLGIPLTPETSVNKDAASLVGTRHLLYDEAMLNDFVAQLKAGKPTAITAGLAGELGERAEGALILPFESKLDLMTLPQEQLDKIRNHLLAPLGVQMNAPTRVAIYLYDEDLVVLENFNDESVEVSVRLPQPGSWKKVLSIPAAQEASLKGERDGKLTAVIPGRSLVALRSL